MKYRNLHWVTPRWSHFSYMITFLLWSSAFRVGCRYSSSAFYVEYCHKINIFVICIDILGKRVIFLLWKKTCCYVYMISLILLIKKSMMNSKALLTHFSNLFQVTADCGLGCDKFKCYFPSISHWFTSSFKESWSKFGERPGLGSSLNEVAPEPNFENQFRIWRSVMTFFCSIFYFLNFLFTPITLHVEYALSVDPFQVSDIIY